MSASDIQSRNKTVDRIPVREAFVSLSAAATLAFTAWCFAGIPYWTFQVLVFGGGLTFFCAYAPFVGRRQSGRFGILVPWDSYRKLLKWPVFWLTFLFMVYLTIGALNPDSVVVESSKGWWTQPEVARLSDKLPTSVEADFTPINAWRVLMKFAGSFLLAYGIYGGLQKRSSGLFILWTFVVSGAGMALIAIVQKYAEAELVLWTVKSTNPLFWGSFLYRNQAVAYLNLVLMVAGCLYLYHRSRARKKGHTSGPHFLCVVIIVLVYCSICLALSRAGIFFATGLIVALAILQVLAWVRQGEMHSTKPLMILAGLMLIVGSLLVVRLVDLTEIKNRFGDVRESIINLSDDLRMVSTRATLDMARDRIWYGWGAGSYRYIFPRYQKNYPEIFHRRYDFETGESWGRRVYYDAHNDPAQSLAEYGIVGCVLLFGAIIYMVSKSYQFKNYGLVAWFFVLGVGQAIAHSLFDLLHSSPAYWFAFFGLLTAILRTFTLSSTRTTHRKMKRVRKPVLSS